MFTLYNSVVEGGAYFIQHCSGGRCLVYTTGAVKGGVYFIQQCGGGRCLL